MNNTTQQQQLQRNGTAIRTIEGCVGSTAGGEPLGPSTVLLIICSLANPCDFGLVKLLAFALSQRIFESIRFDSKDANDENI